MPTVEYRTVLAPLVQAWLAKIEMARKEKKRFKDVSDQCMAFYGGAVDFMWEPDFMRRYIGGPLTPRFKITIAKAFELVSIFGPTMYWRNPTRTVKSRRRGGLSEKLGPILSMPGMEPLAQMYQQTQPQHEAYSSAVSHLMEEWLNYTPDEQPGGGLRTHAHQCLTESLVKGRGCMWISPYMMPASERVLTGAFYDSVENLFIDPDADTIHTAEYIIRKRVRPIWKVEREFGHPEGSLTGSGMWESAWSQSEDRVDRMNSLERQMNRSFDMIEYYEIYSKAGIGSRLSGQVGAQADLGKAFDRVLGDYVYIVISPTVPYPLNAPPNRLESADDVQIRKMFEWPIPYYLDDRWPVSVLDYYFKPGSAWPIAPLESGLGELTFLNVLIASLAGRVWHTNRIIMAGSPTMEQEAESKVRFGTDFEYLKTPASEMGRPIDQQISFLNWPSTNVDTWQMIEQVSYMFDRRTGLSELLYGLSPGGTQSRSAEDAASKREMVSVRPDFMATRVEDFMTEVADMEKLCARWFVEAEDTTGLFSPVEQHLWKQLVTDVDPEFVVRELHATVMANTARRPDKTRDVQNFNQILPNLLPMAFQYANSYGDFNPLNNLISEWGQVLDHDMRNVLFEGPPPQSQDPQTQVVEQLQQQQMQETQARQEQQMVHRAQQHGQKLEHKEEAHDQAIRLKEEMAEIMERLKARSTNGQAA